MRNNMKRCLLPAGCREAANCRYCFYLQAKNQVFLVAPIQVKLCRTDGHLGPLICAKFYLNRHRGWECGPKNIKNFHFLVKSRPQGRLPWQISKIFRGFYTSNYPTLVFQIWHDTVHRLRSYCWETTRQSIRPIFFRAPCRKSMRWIKKWMNSFDGHDELYHHAKLGKDRTMRTGCRCENVVIFPAVCREAATCRYCFYSVAKNQHFAL